jgi:hypothetical protein
MTYLVGKTSAIYSMKFKSKNLRSIAEMVIGDNDIFPYRSSRYITEFFEDCGLNFVHKGSTRWAWAAERLEELLASSPPGSNILPAEFVNVLRILMNDIKEEGREKALEALNAPLKNEGFEVFLAEEGILHARHIASKTISTQSSPHRPLTKDEIRRRDLLAAYLDKCSEDDLINEILMPLFRQLGFHRVTAAGHKDKALEYGKDVWMRFMLPSQHLIYFGIQAKKGKIDSAGVSRNLNQNVAEIYNQALMMLAHEIFDPETNKKALIDHAFIVSGGEITKQARNLLGQRLDASKRSQILFMDREDILNLFVVNSVPLPSGASPPARDIYDEIPF